MLMRTIVTLSAILALGSGNGWAKTSDTRKTPGHRHTHIVRYQEQPVLPLQYGGGRLVLHPASNIACNTPYRSTRALPCDQPVWVYGSPCEVDLGLGRYRSCD
jgi:hypothetical protein